MSDEIVRRCDGPKCKNVKGSANHWPRIIVRSNGGSSDTIILGNIKSWDAETDKFLDFCGEACLHRYLSQQLKLPTPVGEDSTVG